MLHRLLTAYFSYVPKPFFERVYRQLLISGIRFYRIFIRPFIGNECQFDVTCSQLTLELITSRKPFDLVGQQCLQRYCECSLPFSQIRVGNRLLFVSGQGREVDLQEVSQHLKAKSVDILSAEKDEDAYGASR